MKQKKFIPEELKQSIFIDSGTMTKVDICKKYNLTISIVNRIYKEIGIKTAQKECIEIRKLTELQIKEIIDLYQSGKSFEKIIPLLSFKSGLKTVKKVIRRNGIPINKNYTNPMKGTHFYKKWKEKYGEEKANKMIVESKAKLSIKYSGRNNPSFGKSAYKGSGVGWKGWYKNFYFRSLREASYMLYLDDNNIMWDSAEKKKYTIEYVNWDGRDRTYRPDFIINNEKLIEIKPKRLQNSPSVTAKTKAALAWAAENNLKYEIIDFEINYDKILSALTLGILKFDRDYKERFLNYVNKKSSRTILT